MREYWIVDPLSKSLEAYSLRRDKTYQAIESKDDAIQSVVLPKFYIKRAWLWQEKLPKVPALLREMASKR